MRRTAWLTHRLRTNSKHDGIAGVLIVSEAEFVQIPEGPRTAVSRSFMHIMQDNRHQNVRILFAGAGNSSHQTGPRGNERVTTRPSGS
ncbi:MAG: BLUF domain-containing protein [Paracoccus sp. (in: a-proteobacteria)]|uniref:BLUF domain-containing protein n=1 Tax=Paracoccus sp. TaxID=267 RepID=UPI00391DBEFA